MITRDTTVQVQHQKWPHNHRTQASERTGKICPGFKTHVRDHPISKQGTSGTTRWTLVHQKCLKVFFLTVSTYSLLVADPPGLVSPGPQSAVLVHSHLLHTQSLWCLWYLRLVQTVAQNCTQSPVSRSLDHLQISDGFFLLFFWKIRKTVCRVW